MNILPKKRWHVRTKENIARVRRDEAKAKEEELERQKRIELAEKESRTQLLRTISRRKYDGRPEENHSKEKLEHVNFFKDLEEGEDVVKGENKEYHKEKKEEREKYEKQIGYLTYLGQDTVESTGKISWFNKIPERLTNKDDSEKDVNKKSVYDPLEKMNLYMGNKYRSSEKKTLAATNGIKQEEKEKGKSRRHKRKKKRKRMDSSSSSDSTRHAKKDKKRKREDSSSDKEVGPSSKETRKKDKTYKSEEKKPNLEELRAKRLKREEAEKQRAAKLLAKLSGKPMEETKLDEAAVKQKYNSQFNPHLARQNRDSP